MRLSAPLSCRSAPIGRRDRNAVHSGLPGYTDYKRIARGYTGVTRLLANRRHLQRNRRNHPLRPTPPLLSACLLRASPPVSPLSTRLLCASVPLSAPLSCLSTPLFLCQFHLHISLFHWFGGSFSVSAAWHPPPHLCCPASAAPNPTRTSGSSRAPTQTGGAPPTPPSLTEPRDSLNTTMV